MFLWSRKLLAYLHFKFSSRLEWISVLALVSYQYMKVLISPFLGKSNLKYQCRAQPKLCLLNWFSNKSYKTLSSAAFLNQNCILAGVHTNRSVEHHRGFGELASAPWLWGKLRAKKSSFHVVLVSIFMATFPPP